MTSGGSMSTFSVSKHAVIFFGGLHHPPTEAWEGSGGGEWAMDAACFPLDCGGCHPQLLQRHLMGDATCASSGKSHGTGAVGLAGGIT